MTPVNEVPVGKFCKFYGSVVYVFKNDFKSSYSLIPVVGVISTDERFNHKVYVYKRVKKEWVNKAKEWLEKVYNDHNGKQILNGQIINDEVRIDNLTYIENLDILKSYDI